MKACLIGHNLTNFVLAIILNKKAIKVDILTDKNKKTFISNRTVGISRNNINFLNSIIIKKKKYFWPINRIKIFNFKNENSKSLEFKENKKENFFLIKHNDLQNLFLNKCKKLKDISFKNYNKNDLLKLERKNYYNFIINSETDNILSKNFFYKKIQKDLNTTAYTGILKHKKKNNNTAIQIFTKYGPLAFLPLSREKTSIVYSVENKSKIKDMEVKKEILKFNKYYNVIKLSELEKFKLKFSFPRKYIHKNFLIFGDNLHKVHPLAGQGFNMTLRDIRQLSQIIDTQISLGLEIGKSVLLEFEKNSQHKNYIFGASINFINDFFKIDNKFQGKISENVFNLLKNNNFFKKTSISLADKGFV